MTDERSSKPNKKIHPALSRTQLARALSYAFGALLVVSALPPEMRWVVPLVLFLGFLYPTLFYQLAIRMKNTRLIGLAAYSIDAFLWSLAIIATHYSIVVLIVATQLAIISSILMLGLRRGLVSLAVMASVLLTGLQFVDVELTERFFVAQGVYGWLMTMGFMFYIVLLVNRTTRNLVSARHQLQDKNKQIMAQAEQLASLSEVAQMVNSTLDIDQIMKTIMERLNLLSNAAKFTSEGLVRLTAERCRHGKTDCLVVTVTDTGIGMTQEQLERIFDPFSQADASITRQFGGTGLGLSISSKLCAMMGGTLTAQSRKDVGSTFTITIPVEGREHQERRRSTDTVMTDDKAGQYESDHCILDESRKGIMLGASEFLTKPTDRAHLIDVIRRLDQPADRTALVVEDDEATRSLNADCLQTEGWKVHTARNGLEGLKACEQNTPGLIILDLMMPEMDGFEFLDQLRQKHPAVEPTVIVVTTKDLTATDLERLNQGVQRIIQKGNHANEGILREIKRHLGACRT